MALAGHASTQEPQSVHLEASIARASPFSLMASTGHSGSQTPQFTQSELIVYAIKILHKLKVISLLYHTGRKKSIPSLPILILFGLWLKVR